MYDGEQRMQEIMDAPQLAQWKKVNYTLIN